MKRGNKLSLNVLMFEYYLLVNLWCKVCKDGLVGIWKEVWY